ncbi:hypothetical protein HYV88_02065 [Candidatus Woesearchaeota archaeon]|nr:hypothetical protein [Candidatus Woesearchaeota archaeon]
MRVIPRLIIILLVFGITFSLITLSAQVGDVISGSTVKVGESLPFTFISILILVVVFLIISLLIIGLLRMKKKD